MSSSYTPIDHAPSGEYLNFDFSFDPALSSIFPSPPTLPASNSLFMHSDGNLFSQSEQSDLLGFLDGFNPWDVEAPQSIPFFEPSKPSPVPPYSNPHLNTVPDPSTSNRPKQSTRRSSSRARRSTATLPDNADYIPSFVHPERPSVSETSSSSTSSSTKTAKPSNDSETSSSAASRGKPLLSTPQKRLNHIMSEQKRRNAIRDGYAQLIGLLAPEGDGPTINMPTRGRPKGSSRGGKSTSKGKSGVLFRAVEYVKWLEEGRDSLRDEVVRLEVAAGIQQS